MGFGMRLLDSLVKNTVSTIEGKPATQPAATYSPSSQMASAQKSVEEKQKEMLAKYRNSFSNAMISSVMTFDDVRKYLDKTDSSHLIYLATRAQDIADISGTSEKEQMAVDSFKYYVEQKTGHRFDHIYNEKAPVDLRCPSCAGTMKLDKTMSYAVCKFCGYTKVFDVNRLPEAEKERLRAEKLRTENKKDT